MIDKILVYLFGWPFNSEHPLVKIWSRRMKLRCWWWYLSVYDKALFAIITMLCMWMMCMLAYWRFLA